VAAADEARFREAVALANVPTLIPLLVQMTGDLRWLEEPYRPRRNRGMGDNPTGGLPEPVQEEIRSAALDAILAWRAVEPLAIPDPPNDLLVRMLSVSMGEPVPPEYGPMIESEFGLRGESFSRHVRDLDVPEGFGVLVIGAGVSGIAAGIRLEEAGIPYTILERHETVGGTWLENRYPGCGVDTPSAIYSFSFAPRDWSQYFCLRDELHQYLEDVATEAGVRSRIRFGTEVVAAAYDEQEQTWDVDVGSADGSQERLRAKIVISAVGAFSRPKWPAIPGLDSFRGPCVHTARWPEDLDVTGKRVAVIGNGASAMQLAPAIAGEVESLPIFQRSPQWAAPFELFHAEVPEPVRFLSREVPLYRLWYRLRAAWVYNDRLHDALQKDPDWPHPARSVNAINDAHREFFTRYVEGQLGDRQDLLPAVLPDYPPFGKRILLDNGWYRTLTRENVRLVTDRIVEIRAEGIVTEPGDEYEVDVIVCATGFDVVRFLSSVDVRGRGGRSLREVWDDDDARAYLGTAVPGFPNFFILYGPNTQTGHGGSLIGHTESQLNYVLDLLAQMLEHGLGAVEVRQDVYDAYNERVDRAHEQMVWTHPGMETYYRNSRGRVVVNSPFRVVDFWSWTRSANLEDYVVETAPQATSSSTLAAS
jgi:4-hydroxyacetophenone monooxygenase